MRGASRTDRRGHRRPLALMRMDYSDSLSAPVAVLPFARWNGAYDGGAVDGGCVEMRDGVLTSRPPTPLEPGETRPSGGIMGDTLPYLHCVEPYWPAADQSTTLRRTRAALGPASWMGSLIEQGRDATGQYYRRNRYYDPQSGRFTQEDPIGLAGGLNTYGFANGDPVSYSDPYGPCPIPPTNCPPGYFTTRFAAGGAVAGAAIGATAGALVAAPTGELAAPLTVPTGAIAGAWSGTKAGLFVGSAVDAGVQIAPRLDDAVVAMGQFGRAVRRVIGAAGIWIGASSPVPTTDSAGGAEPGRTTEKAPEQQGRRPRRDEEGQRPPNP